MRGKKVVLLPIRKATLIADWDTLDLPEPLIPYINQLKTAKVSENLERASLPDVKTGAQDNQATPSNSPGKSRRLRRDSLENLEADPWASPAVSNTKTSTVRNEDTPSNDAITAAKPTRAGLGDTVRTTSAFTTHSDAGAGSDSIGNLNGDTGPTPDPGAGWGASNAERGGLGGGFGSSGDSSGNAPGGGTVRSLGGGRTTTSGADEVVTVTLLPEKEGMFMFQHHNYEVKSRRRASAVTRRYSDFVWLLDCLHKRYPFRQLPLLPPKRVSGRLRVSNS